MAATTKTAMAALSDDDLLNAYHGWREFMETPGGRTVAGTIADAVTAGYRTEIERRGLMDPIDEDEFERGVAAAMKWAAVNGWWPFDEETPTSAQLADLRAGIADMSESFQTGVETALAEECNVTLNP